MAHPQLPASRLPARSQPGPGTTRSSPPSPSWLLTAEAWSALVAEIERSSALPQEPVGVGGAGPDGRRLQVLRTVLADGKVVDEPGRAAIGREITLREDDGTAVTWTLVLPGDGDPARGCISADSPLGMACLGARAGEVIVVPAPAGEWSVTVVAVVEGRIRAGERHRA
jgi:hypothetical protein